MTDFTKTITDTVPMSVFDRGLTEEDFEEVRKSGPKVVIKNDVPECVLLSPDGYARLIDEIEDARLLALASERMLDFDSSDVLSEAEVLEELGIDAEDLAEADTAEIE